jgi:hypothetical protein
LAAIAASSSSLRSAIVVICRMVCVCSGRP